MSAQALVVKILKDLVRAPSHELDAAIRTTLWRMGEYAQADRVYIFTVRDGDRLDNSYEWVAPGVEPMIDVLQDLPISVIDQWRAPLGRDQAVHIPSVAALPDTSPEKETLTMQGVRSILVAPMIERDTLVGFIGFDVTRGERVFAEDQIVLLKSASDIVQAALTRRETEDLLRAKTRQLDATLAALPDLLFEVDADGCYTGFVAGPRHLMAVPVQDMIGSPLEAVLPPEVGRIGRAAFEQVMATGSISGVRYRLDLPGGPLWFELSGSRKDAADPEGRSSVIFLARNVTEDAMMREELARLGKIVETMSNLVAVLDLQRRIVWVNAAFERQTGWQLAEVKGMVLGDLVRCPDSDPEVSVRLMKALARREPFHGETVNRDRFGNHYWIDFNMLPLQGPDGTVQGFVSVETVITRQKEQEVALVSLAKEANAALLRLENALDALTNGAVVLDADLRIVVVNRAYREMFPELAAFALPGTLLENLLRRGLETGVFAADSTGHDAWLADRIAQYQSPQFIDEVQLPDGRWIRRINNRTSDGGCIAVGIDVTTNRNQVMALDAANAELTRALAERDAAERRMTGIIEGADVGTWEWDIPTGAIRIGGHWAQMLGHDPADFAQLTSDAFRALLHPDDLVMLDQRREADLNTRDDIIEHEFRIRHRDGHYIVVLSRSRVIERGPGGKATTVAGVHLDISDFKQLQQELEAGRTFLEQVMQTSIAAIAVFDGEGLPVYCNREAERLLDVTHDKGGVYNRPVWRIERVEGGDLPLAEQPLQRAMAARGPVRDILFALCWPGGVRRILSANVAPLGDDGQGRVVMSFSDVTDQLAATGRLQEARQRAEDASRAKSVFLANMSHEIRTPLNGVLGMTEVLENTLTEPEHKRIISTIRTSGETLLMVLNSILDMSKIEAGKMVLEVSPFIPAEMLRHTEAVFAVQAEEKGLDFDVLISAGSDKPRLGDPHRIQQILNNLLHNAMKFTETGEVALKLVCKPGKPMVIEISDTGLGMSEAQLARVFDSFEQADGSTTRRFGGTGLGLSIVKQLVSLMGGELSLESAPGKGTRVRVSLPLAETTAGMPAAPVSGPADLPGSLLGRHLLIADDNATNRLVLREMLAGQGVRIEMVENGQQAVDAWVAARRNGAAHDLLLLDITMPVVDGLTALTLIRAEEGVGGEQPVPAIAVTANAMPHQVADYIQAGFDSHLAKPFKQRELLHAIRTLIR